MKQFIDALKQGERVESFFSVKYKHPVAAYKNGFMFVLGLADRSGEIELSYFGGKDRGDVQKLYDSIKTDSVVFASGQVGEFRNKAVINIDFGRDSLRPAQGGEYKLDDFVPTTNQDINAMMSMLQSTIASVKNPHLNALLDSFFGDEKFAEAFRSAPGAMYIHHACVGGLLEHVWGVVQLCETMARIHPSLDRDLLLTGAILHDVGKIAEFEVTTNIRVSRQGMLRGHISLGEEMLIERMSGMEGFPDELRSKLLHIIISHHGKRENGTTKEPQFPEAATIYHADDFDAKITQYIRAKKEAKTEDFRMYHKKLGEIYLG